MWWIIGIVAVCIFAFVWFLNRGSDMKNKSQYAQRVEDEEQEAALRAIKGMKA